MQIPKVIHQIWLWWKMPAKFKSFTETWKNHNSDWEYILWNEDNIYSLRDLKKSDYKKLSNFSEKSDYLRFCIINEHGWVYVDTDFECLKPLQDLIENTTFFIGMTEKYLNTWLFWSVANHPILNDLLAKTPKRILTHQDENSFYKLWPAFVDEIVNSSKSDKLIVPREVFYPFTRFDIINKNNVPNSYAIHHYAMSWNKTWRIKALIIRSYKALIKFLNPQS